MVEVWVNARYGKKIAWVQETKEVGIFPSPLGWTGSFCEWMDEDVNVTKLSTLWGSGVRSLATSVAVATIYHWVVERKALEATIFHGLERGSDRRKSGFEESDRETEICNSKEVWTIFCFPHTMPMFYSITIVGR